MHARVAFFPEGKWRILHAFPEPIEQAEPKNLGERLMRCRLQRRLLQAEAAAAMGINPATLSAWEQGRLPPDRLWPRIVAFLGEDPSPAPTTPGERLRFQRRQAGLSVKALARAVGCDWDTIAKWEQDQSIPSDAQARVLCKHLEVTGKVRALRGSH